jgi:4-hydroxy-tetrahydrodipicolinate synthase
VIDRSWVRQALTGPVSSIRTPFLRDGSLDPDGLRQAIDFNIAAGSRTMLLTAGDSHYFALSDDDIAAVTRTTVEHTNRRAMVVAADRHYNTRQAVAFAKYCRDIGVDVLMVMPPDWAGSCTPETLAAHYAAVAEQIPLMLVTNVFGVHGTAFGLRTLECTLSATRNVVAIKDDICGPFARKMALMVHDHWAIMSGGQKQNHLDVHPYGCDGYLSTFITFKPEIARRYWSAIERSDIPAAARVIRDFDLPFFELVGGVNGGFDAGIHAVLELFGICQRWRRPPYYSLNDAETEHVAEALRKIGLL